MEKIGVIGAGSWGTTLANLLAEKGFPVTLWVYEEELFNIIKGKKENSWYLPGFKLSEWITPTQSINEVVANKTLIISVTPSHVVRDVMGKAKEYLSKETLILSASKGIENKTLKTISQILKDVLDKELHQNIAILSGPSFAKEVAKKRPTAIAVASENKIVAKKIQEIMNTIYFRVYTNTDVIGIEIGAAMKNVIAIAAGISDGLELGYNARSALITRGLVEITRLGVKMGAQPMTFSGLTGLGDLVLTCTGDLSRNRTVGISLGKGEKLNDILSKMKMVAEGIKTTESAYQLANKLGVEMPITEQIYQILYKDKPPKDAVIELMSRELKDEVEGISI